MPPALGAGLDHVGRELSPTANAESAEFLGRRHAAAVGRETVAEHIGDDPQLGRFTDRTVGAGLGADVLGGTQQLGVGVTHLGAADPAEPNLVDEHPPGESVVDDAATLGAPTHDTDRETHAFRVAIRKTGPVTTPAISYGRDLPDDRELRLCGDISDGKRALELGVSREQNALAFALAGAKSIAVDADGAVIEQLRAAATTAEVRVECHESDLADLGFATSASIELVVANHTLIDVDDLGRLLRQVHRVLRASHPFVIAVPHPFAGVHTTDEYGSKVHAYGTAGRTIGDWFTHLGRANFRVDQILELGVSDIQPVPTTLILRARKEGD